MGLIEIDLGTGTPRGPKEGGTLEAADVAFVGIDVEIGIAAQQPGFDPQLIAGPNRLVEAGRVHAHEKAWPDAADPGIQQQPSGLGHALEQDDAGDDRVVREMPAEIGFISPEEMPGPHDSGGQVEFSTVDELERRPVGQQAVNSCGINGDDGIEIGDGEACHAKLRRVMTFRLARASESGSSTRVTVTSRVKKGEVARRSFTASSRSAG